MRPIVVTVGPLANASANNIALSQTPTAGPLTLNGSSASGGVATLDNPRQVLITTGSGAESTKTFTITGTDWSGASISEVVQGPSATTASSVLSYATVTSIVISANAAGSITVGTNGVASSAWVRLDPWADSYVGIQATLSGTGNFTIQQTMDDPNSPTNPVSPANMTWVNTNDTAAVGATSTIQTNYGFAPVFSRAVMNSGNGTLNVTYVQSGVVSR